ncbi:SusD/RagB family nutrient-binding outer membrane lipoprotein [Siphonobacter aquaeclarae]|uniref:Starch-binding associating with outer membrane n=1 Tax=Siphonobacter aquaeclarae TaxID=563176 RepID=A0A1G9HTN4_9BACT|nr:SusD/RagB family nutrient-binding outer membrane lipoprotein [Siphonobacter aquaeclarae]SDL16074.1 Starch-binding associating with outer membrane [Siphonobacter aquaeclarae]
MKRALLLISLVALGLTSCDRQKFAELNTDPDAILNIPPQYELTTGLLNIHQNSFEYYYDYNRAIYYWAQSFVTLTGNSANVYEGSGNLNQRYGNFYSQVGNRLVDVQQIIDKLPEAEKAKYVYLKAITGIPLAYYAWYTSDVNGSIPYTEAFKARYTTPALLTPKYDTQEALYQTLDDQLKAIITVLKTPQTVEQVSLKDNDIYFDGDPAKWIKTANALRLKIAFRLMKRNPDKLKSLATEILADEASLMSSTADDWKFIAGTPFSSGGNYNPTSNSSVSGSKNLIDFMWTTADPRLRVFFQPSPFTKERFDAAKAQGKIPASFAWDGQLYRGQYADPDASLDASKNTYFQAIEYTVGTEKRSDRLPSSVQSRLFYGAFNSGTGQTTFPLITYADLCFMRAELAARNILGTDAQGWYYKGIEASLQNYDDMARYSKLDDYKALTAAEVTAYKASPGVVWDAANGLEQILVQQYLNYFKNQNEAWAVIKRTGFPSVSGKILKLETVHQGGTEQKMPRRFAIAIPTVTDLNYKNATDAIADQQKDPSFGGPSDITGRVWWDKP